MTIDRAYKIVRLIYAIAAIIFYGVALFAVYYILLMQGNPPSIIVVGILGFFATKWGLESWRARG